MKNLIRFGAASALAAMPFAAQAQTITGNLSVETTVPATCSTIVPVSVVDLPFDPDANLNAGQAFTSPVTVNITCDGTPTISNVEFDDGVGLGNSPDGSTSLRYMFRSGGGAGTSVDYLGYTLAAVAGTSAVSGDDVWDFGNNEIETSAGAANANQLENPTQAFQVTARIDENTIRGFGNPSVPASTANVPAGNFSDTVVMTVTYIG